MTLSKREKILLQVLISVAVFALILVFLVIPQIEEKVRLAAEQETSEAQYQDRKELLDNTEIDSQLEETSAQAKENYNYFYGVLNSFSIDGIINGLIQEHGLSVTSLTISDYEDATYDFQKLEEEDIKVLVRSNVNLTVTGNYEHILAFMEALNQKSPCLSADMVSIGANTIDATGKQGMTATFRIYIYGVNVKIEDLDTTQ